MKGLYVKLLAAISTIGIAACQTNDPNAGAKRGVAGPMTDLDSSREDRRNDALAAAIGNNNQQASSENEPTPKNWDRLNDFIGEWNLNAEILTESGVTVTGTLESTTQAVLAIQQA